MRVEFTGRHIDVTEPLKQFAMDRLGRLRALNDIIEVHFTLIAERPQRHVAEVNLKTRNGFHHSAADSSDMYTSIASVLDKIEKQALKDKTRHVKRRKGAVSARVIAAESITDVDSEFAERLPEIVRTDGAGHKPLTVDEAATELAASHNGFLVFRNAQSGRLNVLYHRKDGDIGWIDPEQ